MLTFEIQIRAPFVSVLSASKPGLFVALEQMTDMNRFRRKSLRLPGGRGEESVGGSVAGASASGYSSSTTTASAFSLGSGGNHYKRMRVDAANFGSSGPLLTSYSPNTARMDHPSNVSIVPNVRGRPATSLNAPVNGMGAPGLQTRYEGAPTKRDLTIGVYHSISNRQTGDPRVRVSVGQMGWIRTQCETSEKDAVSTVGVSLLIAELNRIPPGASRSQWRPSLRDYANKYRFAGCTISTDAMPNDPAAIGYVTQSVAWGTTVKGPVMAADVWNTPTSTTPNRHLFAVFRHRADRSAAAAAAVAAPVGAADEKHSRPSAAVTAEFDGSYAAVWKWHHENKREEPMKSRITVEYLDAVSMDAITTDSMRCPSNGTQFDVEDPIVLYIGYTQFQQNPAPCAKPGGGVVTREDIFNACNPDTHEIGSATMDVLIKQTGEKKIYMDVHNRRRYFSRVEDWSWFEQPGDGYIANYTLAEQSVRSAREAAAAAQDDKDDAKATTDAMNAAAAQLAAAAAAAAAGANGSAGGAATGQRPRAASASAPGSATVSTGRTSSSKGRTPGAAQTGDN